MTEYNGGFKSYPDNSAAPVFFRADETYTKPVTVKQGQVLKKHSFVESDTDGKMIAHSGMNEKALVTFPTKVDTGETVIIAGLTFTAGSNATTTQAQLKAAWEGIPVGTGYAAANTLKGSAVSAAIGTFTAGTLTGYNTFHSPTTGAVLFVSTTPNAGVTDLAVTGTGDASSVSVTSINTPMHPVAAVLVMDVDATSTDVATSAYSEASFYADALVWQVDPATDVVTKPDGTTVACTPYNTGATTDILKRKFVEGSKFENLGILKAGESY